MLAFLADSLAEYFSLSVFAFILIFVRLGAALMIMPGIGDTFVSGRIRLVMALGLTFMMTPILIQFMPQTMPQGYALFALIIKEFIIGAFFGTMARIFMTALDTAGMIISLKSGLGNAQLFNPAFAQQGSLMGAMLTVTGIMLLFAANLHHLLIMGLVDSYNLFPVGGLPAADSMAELMSKAVATSFTIGAQIAAPFIVLTMIIYVSMGVISRLMPQIQVFLLALPLQILLALTLLSFVLGAGMMFWLQKYSDAFVYFLTL